jgi:hypothetical protein
LIDGLRFSGSPEAAWTASGWFGCIWSTCAAAATGWETAEVMQSSAPVLAYFGHHKAGSTWIRLIAAAVCRELSLRYAYWHNEAQFGHDLASHLEREPVDFFTHANARGRSLNLSQFRGFHVIRDPRDIIVSAYFSHRFSHGTDEWPALIPHRKKLQELPAAAGLQEEVLFSRRVMIDMGDWDYTLPNVLELRMEEMLVDPAASFEAIFRFLGLLEGAEPPPDVGPRAGIQCQRLLAIVAEHDFQKLSGGRRPGQEDPRSHFRKGIPGDWQNHFTPEVKEFFKRQYPGLPAKLGYARDDDW